MTDGKVLITTVAYIKVSPQDSLFNRVSGLNVAVNKRG